MPLNSLHADHIGGTNGGFELQRSNNALLFIAGLDGNDNNFLTLTLQSVTLPKENTNPVEVFFLNEKRKFAGNTTYEDLTIVFNDYVDKDTAKLLYQWRYLVKNPVTGKVGNKSDYAKAGRVVKYGPDGGSEREYEIVGMWPSALDGGDMDMSSDEGIKINMTLSIDKAIYRPAMPGGNTSAPSPF